MARPRKSDADRRSIPVGFRASPAELAELEDRARAVGLTVGEFCRRAALGRKMTAPPQVPELNREAWADLARAASNLNQIAVSCRANGLKTTGLDQVREALAEFRRRLLGVG